jgi:hypothetical protein
MSRAFAGGPHDRDIALAGEVLAVVERAASQVVGVLSSRRLEIAEVKAAAAAWSPSWSARRARARSRSARSIGTRYLGW